jgi:cytochrome oxidase Cu insertion factor (SCO1/SenC/PrrC family)
MNVREENRRMGVGGRSAIGGTLTLLGLAVALTVGTWLVMGSETRLGPHDGLDLLGIDTGRVAVGDVAPDFSLLSYAGTVTTLSDYRGEKNVVLVFYRGYW